MALSSLFLLHPSGYGKAEDIFVENTIGKDFFSGTSATLYDKRVGPFQSIQRALQVARWGDRIVILPSMHPYHETLTINGQINSGLENAPIIIEGNGSELNGASTVDPFLWRTVGNGVEQLDLPFRGLGVLFHEDQPIDRLDHPLFSEEEPSLAPLQYTQWQGKYRFRVEDKKKIREYPLSVSDLSGGIIVNRASHLVVRNLVIRGYRVDAVQVHGPAESIRFENCRFADNGRAGISISNNVSVTLSDCSIDENRVVGLKGDLFAKVKMENSAITGKAPKTEIENTTKFTEDRGERKPLAPAQVFIPDDYRKLRMRNVPPTPKEEALPADEAPKAPPKKKDGDSKKKNFFDQ